MVDPRCSEPGQRCPRLALRQWRKSLRLHAWSPPFCAELGFNVRRSDEFPLMRGPRARAPSEKGGYGGRFAASMTLEILHGALVLLGRRPRLERAEITAAAGFLGDFARIEAIAARPELADHRRPPRAARTRPVLRFCRPSLCSRCHRGPPSMVSTLVNRKERAKVPALSRDAPPHSRGRISGARC